MVAGVSPHVPGASINAGLSRARTWLLHSPRHTGLAVPVARIKREVSSQERTGVPGKLDRYISGELWC